MSQYGPSKNLAPTYLSSHAELLQELRMINPEVADLLCFEQPEIDAERLEILRLREENEQLKAALSEQANYFNTVIHNLQIQNKVMAVDYQVKIQEMELQLKLQKQHYEGAIETVREKAGKEMSTATQQGELYKLLKDFKLSKINTPPLESPYRSSTIRKENRYKPY